MLDDLNKDLENNKNVVLDSNKNLFKAAEIGKKSRKSQWMCLLLLFVIISAVAIVLLYQAGIIGNKG